METSFYVSAKVCIEIQPIFIRFIDHKRLQLKGWYVCQKCNQESRGEDLVFDINATGIPEFKCSNLECVNDFFQLQIMGDESKRLEIAEKQAEAASKTPNVFHPFEDISIVREKISGYGGIGWEALRLMIRNSISGNVVDTPLRLYAEDETHKAIVKFILKNGIPADGTSLEVAVRQTEINKNIPGNIAKIRKLLGELGHMGYVKAEKSTANQAIYWGIQEDRV